MPFVRVDLNESAPYDPKSVAESVHEGLIASLNIPSGDRFQVVTRRGDSELFYDSNFLDIQRTDGIVLIELTIAQGRDAETKKSLYAAIAERLAKNCSVRTEDVFIVLHEQPTVNFSFGNGQAQFADALPPHLRQAEE